MFHTRYSFLSHDAIGGVVCTAHIGTITERMLREANDSQALYQALEAEAALSTAHMAFNNRTAPKQHPAECLCDTCVVVSRGKVFYRDGITEVLA